ncbi:MAG: hypothetical protein JO273_10185 [Methylobacteriaceae bacterium]|nr:hypothetical protein [Methylobacteriaceae bacterium]
MGPVWNTKAGPRRVRYDPPTLAEAVTAAQGLTDNVHQQAEIAASLMDISVEQAMAEVLKARPPRRAVDTVAFTTRKGVQRAAIVERRVVRRPVDGRRFGY